MSTFWRSPGRVASTCETLAARLAVKFKGLQVSLNEAARKLRESVGREQVS
jgi:hypothetical protein